MEDIRLYRAWSGRTTTRPTWDTALSSILADPGVSDKTVGVEANFVVTLGLHVQVPGVCAT